MNKSSLVLFWFFALSSFAYADASPVATAGVTLTEAQAAVSLAKTALDQAAAWESLAKKNLDKANKALAQKPKSASAKQAEAAARKELNSATTYKTKTEAQLREELQEKSTIAKVTSESEEKNKTGTTNKVTVYPEEKYKSFANEYESAERVDAYFFFNDPLDYKNKTVILDAKFDEMISPSEAKFTVWRNFGKMNLIVSNIPAGYVIPKDKTMLLAGVITGFNKEVVSGELILNTLLKLKGVFICGDSRCHS